MSEARTDRLEAELRETKEAVIRIEAMLSASLPHLATKAELASETGTLRAELASETGKMRAELASDIGTLRAELASEISTLRAELASEIGTLRAGLADKPGKVFLATAIGILIAAYALGLAGLAALPTVAKLLRLAGAP